MIYKEYIRQSFNDIMDSLGRKDVRYIEDKIWFNNSIGSRDIKSLVNILVILEDLVTAISND